MGYQISPILWDKVRRGLSAGHVQSVAVRLSVERKRKILVFKPEGYWMLASTMKGKNPPKFLTHVIKKDKFRPNNAEHAQQAAQTLCQAEFKVSTSFTRV